MSLLSLAALIKSVASPEAPPAPQRADRKVRLRWRPDEAGDPVLTSAALDEHEAWGLFVMASQELPDKAVVTVEDDGASYQTQIVGRRQVREGWELELAYIGEGRRREIRTPVSGSAEVEVSNDGRYLAPVRQAVEVTDVSSGGMRLHSSEPIKAGATLRISGEKDLYFGVARYCFESKDGYDIGVQFVGLKALVHDVGDD